MIFDGGLFLGRDPKTGAQTTTQSIHDRACCATLRAVYDDMHEGNRECLELAQTSHGHLVPLAVLNPLHWDLAADSLTRLKSSGFKGLLFCPSLQSWSVNHYSFQCLLKKALALRLPIQFVVTQPDEITTVAALSKGSSTPILLRFCKSGGYSFLADLIAIGKTQKNIYVDVSHLTQIEGIALLGRSIGFDRLFWGSSSPLNLESPSRLLIELESQLTERQKSQILGENLKRLFKVKDQTTTKMRLRHPDLKAHLDRPKIDTHWHSHGWDILEPARGLKRLKDVCDQYNYLAVGISSVKALNYDLLAGNESTFDAIEADKRFYAYVVVDPLRPLESMNLLEKFSKHPRFLGIKTIQDYYGLDLNDERYRDFWSWAKTHGCPVMAHIPGIVTAARQHPQVKFIAAHTTWDRLGKLRESDGTIPTNLYFDIATSHCHREATNLSALVAAVGPDRILFSSDGPLISPAWTLGKVIEADLSSPQLDRLYLGNAREVFGLSPQSP